ncbi:hypothetical protein FPV67DRAFT_1418769, partial [Lyophyllum atratum]
NDDEDSEDATFSASQQSSDDESERDSDLAEITNDELADMLPSKTVPVAANPKKPTTRKSSKKFNTNPTAPRAKKSRTAMVEEIEDEDSPRNIAVRQPQFGGDRDPQPAKSGIRKPGQEKRNPIYLFYEQVTRDAHGKSESGSKYYKCYHGNRKTLVITKAMKGNLNGLMGHLKHFPSMEHLYQVLKSRSEPPTPNEIAIASGKSPLDPKAEAEYLRQLETASENIQRAFEKQKAEAAGPWDQEKFEHLIAEWIVACDQPFEEVERPEFVDMMTYAHHPAPEIKIPGRNAIRRRVMNMGEDTVEGIRKMFEVSGLIMTTIVTE